MKIEESNSVPSAEVLEPINYVLVKSFWRHIVSSKTVFRKFASEQSQPVIELRKNLLCSKEQPLNDDHWI
jgi:hypothetical protein